MRHIRLFNHYINAEYIPLALLEFGLLMGAVWAAVQIQFRNDPAQLAIQLTGSLPSFVAFAVVLSLMGFAMRVYPARFREGHTGMALRTLVAFFLLGGIALTVLGTLFAQFYLPQGVLLYALPLALLAVSAFRFVFFALADDTKLARRVIVLGAGQRARVLLERLGGKMHRPGLQIVGFVPGAGDDILLPPETLLRPTADLLTTAHETGATEIVVAADERRSSEGGNYPLEKLLDCKLAGIEITDGVNFLERELEKVEIDLVRPSWLVFSDGFRVSARRDVAKRGFDLAASLTLLAVAWPFMLLTALAIWLESGLRGPILYHQERVGFGGCTFMVAKFRSMRTDAEQAGKAVWAKANDDRVTRVGRFIRATRLDELPQLWNIINGEMSFVGPRPERPQFTEELAAQIPYFRERLRVKPGLAGWAQLCFPYGASVEDAAEKLRYDLFYIKNHTILMDLLILIQTVEVVLVGRGVR
ncbi:MAG: TIGR03013 family XrtA/PEP-CTERM system glycosyltransferase [Gammaproteobacteria bacterium]